MGHCACLVSLKFLNEGRGWGSDKHTNCWNAGGNESVIKKMVVCHGGSRRKQEPVERVRAGHMERVAHEMRPEGQELIPRKGSGWSCGARWKQ